MTSIFDDREAVGDEKKKWLGRVVRNLGLR
jgi:hypothetical protein